MAPIETLLSHARRPDELDTIAIAGIIGTALARGRRPLITDLSEARFQKLLNEHFTGIALTNGESAAAGIDEFDDLLELLLEHRAQPTEPAAWLAYAVASAAMGENHLWEDMGLPSRRHLSDFLRAAFPALAAKNEGGVMKWKKFFYRQLCERAEVPICKSPHCAECPDYTDCFAADS
jgi:nitrogen fixation protein NifQ